MKPFKQCDNCGHDEKLFVDGRRKVREACAICLGKEIASSGSSEEGYLWKPFWTPERAMGIWKEKPE